MYGIVLTLHSLNRWLVLLAALWAVGRMVRGWVWRKEWTAADRQAGVLLTSVMDLQFTLGLLLYAISPLVRSALSDFGAAMKVTELRFFALEHITMMIIAVTLAHVGSALGRRSTTEAPRHRAAAICYLLSLAVILGSIPWWRPLLRGF